MPNATIAFCVIEDSSTLQDCLDSFLAAENFFNNGEANHSLSFDVIIVYNGHKSNFETFCSVYESKGVSFQSPLRIVFSTEFNLSAARNKALSESSSDWILFLDDDAILDKSILKELEQTIYKCEKESILLAGGRVLLRGTKQLTEFHRAWLSMLDLGEPSRIIQNSYVNGANFLVNRKAAEKVGGFDLSLGRQKGLLISGEESDLIHRMVKTDPRIYYNHNQIVVQVVPPSREDREYLGKRVMWEAVTRALILQKESPVLGERNGWRTPSDKELDNLLQLFTQLLVFGKTKENKKTIFTRILNCLKKTI
jgi:glycosyltransferase involved in cell wall biosynthesis